MAYDTREWHAIKYARRVEHGDVRLIATVEKNHHDRYIWRIWSSYRSDRTAPWGVVGAVFSSKSWEGKQVYALNGRYFTGPSYGIELTVESAKEKADTALFVMVENLRSMERGG